MRAVLSGRVERDPVEWADPALDIEMQPVESSWIKAIGHDRASNTMRIETHSGKQYDYPEVDEELFRKQLSADSPGKHFNRYFRRKIAA